MTLSNDAMSCGCSTDAGASETCNAAAAASDVAAGTLECQNAAIADGAHRGVFITFEGGEGAGKTTHIKFLERTLAACGREVVCLREPGGTAIGEALRSIVLDPAHGEMSSETELLIYEAARAQIVSQLIKPALDRGAVVLCDRFFDSTTAYQGYGRGLDAAFIQAANAFACKGTVPDRTILLVPPTAAAGLDRAATVQSPDRLEQAGLDFHNRVSAGFAAIAQENPQRVRMVESSSQISVTARRVFAQLTDLFYEFDAYLGNDAFFAQLDAPAQEGGHV